MSSRIKTWVICTLGLFVAFLAITVPAHAVDGKKVYLLYDMEGVTGAVKAGDYDTTSPDYPVVRQSLTDDVNAAIAGLKKAGVTDIVIADGHASGNDKGPDYLVDQLPAGAHFDLRDKPYDPYVDVLDKSFDALVLIGYHVRGGSTQGFTPHTYFGTVQWEMNGMGMSETSEVGIYAAYLGIPLILVSGDDYHKPQVAEFSKAEYVIVKHAVSASVAEARDRATVSAELTAAAERGMRNRKSIGYYKIPATLTNKWIFPYAELTAMTSNYPGVTIENDKTLVYQTNSYKDALAAYTKMSNIVRYFSDHMMIEALQATPDGAAKIREARRSLPPRDYTPTGKPLYVDNKLANWGYE